MPTIDTVQTRGAWPLRRAWQRFAHRVLLRAGHHEPEAYPTASWPSCSSTSAADEVESELVEARRHRSRYVGVEEEPVSIAEGILDDETYDWAAVLEGMVRTGGAPVVVDATIADANERARTRTGIDVSHTGSAGLAGLIALRASGDADPGERVAATVHRRASPVIRERTRGGVAMRSFLGRDILSLKDFERDEFFHVFHVADELKPYARDRRNGDLLAHKSLVTAFYQPSTRTRLPRRPRCTGSEGTCSGSATRR